MSTLERIVSDGQELALILRRTFTTDGIAFLTPDDYTQQLGYMKRPEGYEIPPHVHNEVRREVLLTKEVLFVRSGRMRVDFYGDDRGYLESRVLEAGDVMLLVRGGHGFSMLEETEIIEVKQGPYGGDKDKSRFDAIPETEVRWEATP